MRGCFEQVDKLLSQLDEAVFFSPTSALIVLQETLRVHSSRIIYAVSLGVPTMIAALGLAVVAAEVTIVEIFTLAPLRSLQPDRLSLLGTRLWQYLSCKSGRFSKISVGVALCTSAHPSSLCLDSSATSLLRVGDVSLLSG